MKKIFTKNGVKYEIDNNEITIIGLVKRDIPHLVIPDEIEGLPVRWINAHAFKNKGFLTVSLPEAIIKIPNATFYQCYALKEIEFRGDNGVPVEISLCGIGYCANLTTIKSKRPIKKIYGDASIQCCDKLKISEI